VKLLDIKTEKCNMPHEPIGRQQSWYSLHLLGGAVF